MIWIKSSSIKPVRLAHLVGALLVVSGLVFWGAKLFAPKARPVPAIAQVSSAADPAGEVVAQWLGPGAVRLNVAVLGLARRNDRAVALLSVNDAAPKPYMTGETLMPDVTLRAIEADGVVLEHAGRSIRIQAPARPESLADGIVRVP